MDLRQNRFHPGFSLVEVMIALSIVGVLAAILVVTLSTKSRGDHVTRGAEAIYADCVFMRMRAATTKIKHRIRFSSTTEWRIEQYVGGGPPDDWEMIESIRHMPQDAYLTLESFENAGSNLVAKSTGLYEFENGMDGTPYVTVTGLGSPKTTSVHVYTGGAIKKVNN
jgi:prepilin-type N-terminal cleavage/methylation domain-containing protein